MADPQRPAPGKPSHPGHHPTSISGRRDTTRRWIGIAVGIVVLLVAAWLLFGRSEGPTQESPIGQPAGFGQPENPDAAAEVDPAADPEDPQAAIGADPFTEPTSPAAAEQADAPPAAGDDTDEPDAAVPPSN